MHRWGAFDAGRALGYFITTISSFNRYGTEFPEDAVVPQDPQNLLGCPGARNRILSIELPIFQLNSCLRDIVHSCGKMNDEEGRGRRLCSCQPPLLPPPKAKEGCISSAAS